MNFLKHNEKVGVFLIPRSSSMKNIFLNLHSSRITGPIDYLKDFLLRNNYKVSYLSHPLDDYHDRYTEFYGEKVKSKKIKRKNIGLINLFFDFLISLNYLLLSKFDTFIGANNFDVLPAIFAKKLLRKDIEKIIYFASDFSEDRFKNKFLNSVYYFVEKIVLENSDLVVSNTKRAEKKRFDLGLDSARSLVIPNGVYLKNKVFLDKKLNKRFFIFVGSVTAEHGLYNLLSILSPLIDKLVLIGSGDEWDRVVGFCNEKNINLETHYRKDHDFTLNYLQKFNGIGLAPYNMDSKWTYYCSPLKVNEYIACGVPVLMSDVPEIAGFIEEGNFGVTYHNLNLFEIEDKISNFNCSEYQKRAEEFYEIYNYENLYKRIGL